MAAKWRDYWQTELLRIGREVEGLVKQAHSPGIDPAAKEAAEMKARRAFVDALEAFNQGIKALFDEYEEEGSNP